MINSAAAAPAYSYASPSPVTTSADFCAAPAPAIDSAASAPAVTKTAPAHVITYVSPSPAVSHATPGSLINSEASAPAVTDTTPVPVSEYVAPAPVTVHASTSSNIAACAAPDPVRGIIARSDALAAEKLKREAWQATRAPVIEHEKTSPAGAYAGPKRKAKAKHDAQAVQDLIREADRQAYAARKAAGSLQHLH